MYQLKTEPEWVYDYFQNRKKPLPIVLGTRGTWSVNRKPIIILIGFTMTDLFFLADMYGAGHHPVREMNHKDVTYYAINIINKRKVQEIMKEWKQIVNE